MPEFVQLPSEAIGLVDVVVKAKLFLLLQEMKRYVNVELSQFFALTSVGSQVVMHCHGGAYVSTLRGLPWNGV